MYNELIFFLQIALILFSIAAAKKMGKEALMSLSILLVIFANLFVMKQTDLFGLSVTCSDAYVIGYLLSLNLLQQYYGSVVAKKMTHLSFAATLFFAMLTLIHLGFTPATCDTAHLHYQAILGITPRLFLASLTAFYTVQKLDLFLFQKLVFNFPKLSWYIRSLISLLICQAADTFLFTFLGLYGALDNISSIFWMSFVIKCVIITFMTTFFPDKPLKTYEI